MRNKTLLTGLFAMILLWSCETRKETHHEASSFLVTSPIVLDTSIVKEYVCQIHSVRHIELRALEKGYLQNIYVDEGQTVRKGQSMFHIMPNIYQAELQKAQAEARMAEIEFQNTKLLADQDVVSQNELAMAQAQLEKAWAEVSLAQTHLGFTNIRAPFDGIMDHLHVREGSLLDEGELLTTLSDNSKMWVYFNVPESEYLDYITHRDQTAEKQVSLLMANNQLFSQKGVVETIEGEFNNETGNIAFRATFPNPDGILRHGETGTIRMRVPLTGALIIPQKATFQVLDKTYVFVLDRENHIIQREITVGAELPHLFAVASGLKADDRILLEGLRMVAEGEAIRPEFTAPQSVMSNLELYAE